VKSEDRGTLRKRKGGGEREGFLKMASFQKSSTAYRYPKEGNYEGIQSFSQRK
jgi:hypothetical protein